nr:MAG TPA: hypothetical protein [Caudoviricetes sp.]DAS89060.1 MAG TPA: hypothetical protein [Caudoviricetes sp.]
MRCKRIICNSLAIIDRAVRSARSEIKFISAKTF